MFSGTTHSLNGTDKLTRGHGPAPHKLGSNDQEYFISSHFEPYLSDLFALKFHFLSENKLTCQCHNIASVLIPGVKGIRVMRRKIVGAPYAY